MFILAPSHFMMKRIKPFTCSLLSKSGPYPFDSQRQIPKAEKGAAFKTRKRFHNYGAAIIYKMKISYQ